MESYHAINFRGDRRAFDLGDIRDGGSREAPFGCRLANQANNSRAWRADSFLTFLTASSTVLMVDTLTKRLASGKRGFEKGCV